MMCMFFGFFSFLFLPSGNISWWVNCKWQINIQYNKWIRFDFSFKFMSQFNRLFRLIPYTIFFTNAKTHRKKNSNLFLSLIIFVVGFVYFKYWQKKKLNATHQPCEFGRTMGYWQRCQSTSIGPTNCFWSKTCTGTEQSLQWKCMDISLAVQARLLLHQTFLLGWFFLQVSITYWLWNVQ